jgi:hypothetical protein
VLNLKFPGFILESIFSPQCRETANKRNTKSKGKTTEKMCFFPLRFVVKSF